MVTLRAIVVGFCSAIIILQNVFLFLLLILLLCCLLTTKNIFHAHTLMLLVSLLGAAGAGNLTRTVGASAHVHEVLHNVSVKSITSICSNLGILFNFVVDTTLGGILAEHVMAFLGRKYGYHDASFPFFFVFVLGLWLFAGMMALPRAIGQCSAFASHVVSFGIAAVSTALFHLITWYSLGQLAKDIVRAEEQMDFAMAAQRRLDVANTNMLRRSFTWISIFYMIGALMLALAELFKGDQERTIANLIATFFNGCGSAAVVYTLLKEHPKLQAKARELRDSLLFDRTLVNAAVQNCCAVL